MKKYVVIDTNVLVSALITRIPTSPTVKIFHFLAENKIIPVYSAEIIKEYGEVLKRTKFNLPEEIIVRLLNDITENGLEITELDEIKEKIPDPKDVVFYAVTLAATDKDTVLVTGNAKHFPVKSFIVTPAELIDLMNQ